MLQVIQETAGLNAIHLGVLKLKLVGHKDVTLYEMQGYDHGNMPQPAYYILKQHIKSVATSL